MNALNADFGFSAEDCGKTISLTHGDHLRVYSTDRFQTFGEELTKRQIDLMRIATAVHAVDSWSIRRSKLQGLRKPALKVDVLDLPFWSEPDTLILLKRCVDFVSGGDDWEFSFSADKTTRHVCQTSMFSKINDNALVSLYSGGLDSSTGLAIRAAAQPDRLIVPVTIRHQNQKAKLLRDQFKLLKDRGILNVQNFSAFQAGAFIRKKRIARDLNVRFGETTHRCRPFQFMALAGLVAHSLNATEVEVFESGVGAVNYPIVGGPADYRTTRSTHPNFLRLISALVSRVSDCCIEYVLPFGTHTKAELVAMLKPLGLESLARKSVSCILHPLQKKGSHQCGRCAACVFRRQAMLTAGITEKPNDYLTDLFAAPTRGVTTSRKHLQWINAFQEQAARLKSLENGIVPPSFSRYLNFTKAASDEQQVKLYTEIYRRYSREWMALIEDCRQRNVPWFTRSFALEGAI